MHQETTYFQQEHEMFSDIALTEPTVVSECNNFLYRLFHFIWSSDPNLPWFQPFTEQHIAPASIYTMHNKTSPSSTRYNNFTFD